MAVGQFESLEKSFLTEEFKDEKPPSLLVVDDDPDILRIVKFFLAKQNYEVYAATNGEEALTLLDQHQEIELILSDVMMPKINGLDLLKLIRQDPRFAEIPLILISAEGETSQKVAGLNLGADDFITKPFNFDELMARVRNHLRLRRLQKELVLANDLLKRQNELLLEDLETAKGVQMALMPDHFPKSKEYCLASRYLPVERLGGDLFDVVSLEGGNKIGIIILDVVGHGVAAALITAMTKITFRNACFNSMDPGEVLNQMNHELYLNLKSGYVTAFYAVYDISSKTLTYASGGHPPLLVHRPSEDKIIELQPQATFLGFFEKVDFHSDAASLQTGDRIIFYTDGLFESQNEQGDPYGMDRVFDMIKKNNGMEIHPFLNALLDDLHNFMASQSLDDDITIVGWDILA